MRIHFLGVIIYVLGLLPGWAQAQAQHQVAVGITQTYLMPTSRIPDGTSQSGTLHISGDFVGRTGASFGYSLRLPINHILSIFVGMEGQWLRSSFQYSTSFYGASCTSCQSFSRSEKVGLSATYSNVYLRIPAGLAIPFTPEGRTRLLLGTDFSQQLWNGSQWRRVEITYLHEQVDNVWTSSATTGQVGTESLPVNRQEWGAFIGVEYQFSLKQTLFSCEGHFRIGLNSLYPQPALTQYTTRLSIGYIFSKKQ